MIRGLASRGKLLNLPYVCNVARNRRCFGGSTEPLSRLSSHASLNELEDEPAGTESGAAKKTGSAESKEALLSRTEKKCLGEISIPVSLENKSSRKFAPSRFRKHGRARYVPASRKPEDQGDEDLVNLKTSLQKNEILNEDVSATLLRQPPHAESPIQVRSCSNALIRRVPCTLSSPAKSPAAQVGLLKPSEKPSMLLNVSPVVQVESEEPNEPPQLVAQPGLVQDGLAEGHQEPADEAIVDVYNYAARFGYLPEVSHSLEGEIWTVLMELPEQGLSSVSESENLQKAEDGAANLFKQAAADYQLKHDTDKIDSLDVRPLNTSLAWRFLRFYQSIHPEDPIVESNGSDAATEGRGPGKRLYTRIATRRQEKLCEVVISTKKLLLQLSRMSIAMHILKENPALLKQFWQTVREEGRLELSLSPNSLTMMETIIDAAKSAELEHQQSPVETWQRSWYGFQSPDNVEKRSMALKRLHLSIRKRPDLAGIRKIRASLPISHAAREICRMVNNHVYSIIVGATGSGKTTQVPQILLDHAVENNEGAACNIICTQPRRIATTSVAHRVATERGQQLQEQVGYSMRHDFKPPQPHGSITYCTTGTLLKQLQEDSDGVLDHASHIVVDEVHERSLLIDFLLIVLKEAIEVRVAARKRVPKIVFMSATMDSELFATHFTLPVPGGGRRTAPSLTVPGRAFPVKEVYLDEILKTIKTSYEDAGMVLDERYLSFRKRLESEKVMTAGAAFFKKGPSIFVPHALIATFVAHLARSTDDGAILVFLPGLKDLIEISDMLLYDNFLKVDFSDGKKYALHLLHSSLAAEKQDVFAAAPKGCRKIILATDIAETSVTIPDVKYVIDCGKKKERTYDQIRRVSSLSTAWISKSNVTQRKGRAGRVQNGHYFAIFTEEQFNTMRSTAVPEILKADILETILQVKAHAFKGPVARVLGQALEPPSSKAVTVAIQDLVELDAITADESLTPLGRLLAHLPVHPGVGKMIVLSIVFRCLDPILIIAAAHGQQPMFAWEPEAQAKKRMFSRSSKSDQIALLNAFCDVREIRSARGAREAAEFMSDNYIRADLHGYITSTADQVHQVLVEAAVIPPDRCSRDASGQPTAYGDAILNENSHNQELIKAILLSGLGSNIATATNDKGTVFRTWNTEATVIDSLSVNAPFRTFVSALGMEVDDQKKSDRPRLIAYKSHHTYKTGSEYLSDTTEITPLMAALFGGPIKHGERDQNEVTAGHLSFKVRPATPVGTTADTLIAFREALEKMKTAAFNSMYAGDGKQLLGEHPLQELFAKATAKLLQDEMTLMRKAAVEEQYMMSHMQQADWFVHANETQPEDEEGSEFLPRPGTSFG